MDLNEHYVMDQNSNNIISPVNDKRKGHFQVARHFNNLFDDYKEEWKLAVLIIVSIIIDATVINKHTIISNKHKKIDSNKIIKKRENWRIYFLLHLF